MFRVRKKRRNQGAILQLWRKNENGVTTQATPLFLSKFLQAVDEPQNHLQFLFVQILLILIDCLVQFLLIVHIALPHFYVGRSLPDAPSFFFELEEPVILFQLHIVRSLQPLGYVFDHFLPAHIFPPVCFFVLHRVKPCYIIMVVPGGFCRQTIHRRGFAWG